MGSASTALVELTALRGLSPRQNKRLTMEALLEGTLYAEALAYDWEEDQDAFGGLRESRLRRPKIIAGAAADRFRRAHGLLVGERVFPSIEAPGEGEAEQEALDQALEDVDIREALSRCARGMMLGSGVMGFHRVDVEAIDGTTRERFEDAALDATWCEPVYVSQVDSPPAMALARDVARVAPELVDGTGTDEDPWTLRLPVGEDSLDLAFLRHEWKVEQEERQGAGVATQTVITWYRVDYTPDAVVHYLPAKIYGTDDRPPSFDLDRIDVHGWRVVPAVWVTPPGTKPGEVDGLPFLTPQVRSVDQGMDYIESWTHDAAAHMANPQVVFLDVEDNHAMEQAALHGNVTALQVQGSPRKILVVQSTDQHQGDVKLLETSGKAVEAGHARAQRLSAILDRQTGIVQYEQAEASGTLSGEALKRMMTPTLDWVDAQRPRLTKAIKLLVAKMARAEGASWGAVDVGWPEVVEPTAEDIEAYGRAFGTMVQQGVFPRDAAMREIAKRLGREDVDELSAMLQREEQERLQQAMDMAAQRMDNEGADDGDD